MKIDIYFVENIRSGIKDCLDSYIYNTGIELNFVQGYDNLRLGDLLYENGRLMLVGKSGERPIYFDIDSIWHKLSQSKRSSEDPLFKALGKDKSNLFILDGTYGTGADSLQFLNWGHKVVAYERNPKIFLLAMDAWWNFSLKDQYKEKFKLIFGDVFKIDSISKFTHFYFDPMFEKTKNKSQSNKEMEIFHFLENSSATTDVFEMLKIPFVVVKRSLKAPRLWSNVNFEVKGKTIRYDVYRN